MLIWSSRGHSVALIWLVTTFGAVWSTRIVAAISLLVLVPSSIVRALVVRMTVWVVTNLWLLLMAWLRLSALGGSWLLALRNRVWSGVATVLTLSGSCIARLSGLCSALGELRGVLGLWTIVSWVAALLRGGSILALGSLLLAVLLLIVAIVRIALLLGIGSVVRRELVRSGGESPRLWLRLRLRWLGWVAFERTLGGRSLLAESIIWLWRQRRLLHASLSITTVLTVLSVSLGSLLSCSLSTLVRSGGWKTWGSCWMSSCWQASRLLWSRNALRNRSCLCVGRRKSGSWGYWRVLWWLSTGLSLLTISIHILLARTIQVEGTKLDSSSFNLAIAWHADSLFLVEDPTLIAGSSTRRTCCLLCRSLESTGWGADGLWGWLQV